MWLVGRACASLAPWPQRSMTFRGTAPTAPRFGVVFPRNGPDPTPSRAPGPRRVRPARSSAKRFWAAGGAFPSPFQKPLPAPLPGAVSPQPHICTIHGELVGSLLWRFTTEGHHTYWQLPAHPAAAAGPRRCSLGHDRSQCSNCARSRRRSRRCGASHRHPGTPLYEAGPRVHPASEPGALVGHSGRHLAGI